MDTRPADANPSGRMTPGAAAWSEAARLQEAMQARADICAEMFSGIGSSTRAVMESVKAFESTRAKIEASAMAGAAMFSGVGGSTRAMVESAKAQADMFGVGASTRAMIESVKAFDATRAMVESAQARAEMLAGIGSTRAMVESAQERAGMFGVGAMVEAAKAQVDMFGVGTSTRAMVEAAKAQADMFGVGTSTRALMEAAKAQVRVNPLTGVGFDSVASMLERHRAMVEAAEAMLRPAPVPALDRPAPVTSPTPSSPSVPWSTRAQATWANMSLGEQLIFVHVVLIILRVVAHAARAAVDPALDYNPSAALIASFESVLDNAAVTVCAVIVARRLGK